MAGWAMKTWALAIWTDDSGTVITTELLLTSSIVVAGILMTGQRIRGALTSEITRIENSLTALREPGAESSATETPQTQDQCTVLEF